MSKKLSPFWILFILTGLNLFNYIDRYVLSAVRTPLAADFGLNYGESGRLFTVFMLGYFLTSPFFGYFGDRLSRKWLIASGIFVWSLGTVMTGLAAGFWQLLLFRILVGVGEASYASISPGLISDAYGPRQRNNAGGIGPGFYPRRFDCGQVGLAAFFFLGRGSRALTGLYFAALQRAATRGSGIPCPGPIKKTGD
jgi:MFS family permease